MKLPYDDVGMYWNKFFIIFSKIFEKSFNFFSGPLPLAGQPAASRAPKTPKWKSWDGYTSYYKTKYEIQWGKRFSFERRGGHGRRITTCLYWHFVKEFSCEFSPARARSPEKNLNFFQNILKNWWKTYFNTYQHHPRVIGYQGLRIWHRHVRTTITFSYRSHFTFPTF